MVLYCGTLCFLLGLYLTLQNALQGSSAVFFAAAACLLFLAVAGKFNRCFGVLLCASFFLLGAGSGARVGLSAAEQLSAYFGRQVVCSGRIEAVSVRRTRDYTSLIMQCESVQQGSEAQKYTGRLRLALAGSQKLPDAGSIIVSGTLDELASLRYPGTFDGTLYNRVNNLGGRLRQAKLLRTQEDIGISDRLALLNLRLGKYLEEGAGVKAGALLAGMTLGGSSRLDAETREIFAANGLAHLLSVSGTHLVLLTLLLSLLLRPVPARWRKGIVLGVLIFYALLCGLRPPVLRALLMSAALLLGGSGAARGRLLCLTAVVLLVYKPLWLLDIGMQLSFGAAAGLLWLLPACKRVLPCLLPECVGEGVAVTLAAQLAVVPVLLSNFHQLSLISLLSNIILVPVLELSAVLALAGCLLPGAEALLRAAGFLAEQVLVQAEFLRSLPYSTLTIGTLPAWTAVIYYALLALWADVTQLQFLTNMERRVSLLLLAAVLCGTLLFHELRSIPLTAYFLDVGQGDCVVMLTPKRRALVYDTGGLAALDTGSRVLAPFLRSLGVRKIDLLLLSHYDFDHAGGTPGLLQNIEVEEIVLPNEALAKESTQLYRKILRAAGSAKIETASRGRRWDFGDNIALELLDVPTEKISGNEASTLAALRSDYASLLLTGDMGSQREEQLALHENFTVLKAGHHGSRHSSSAEFLQQVRPRICVISCGRANRYGHPHAEALTRLQVAGSKILRTDELGAVRIIFDEEISCAAYTKNFWQELPKAEF